MEDRVFKKMLDSLKADVSFFSGQMKEIAGDLVTEGFTKHPVFVAHQHEVKLGEVAFDKEEYKRSWTFNVTTLEEMIEKKVVHQHKREAFEKAYKDPARQACIFWVTEDGASFVFVPYPKK